MRVLFTVSDHASHYFPMVPLGLALMSAGHEVRAACWSQEETEIKAAGLTAVPMFSGPDMMVRGRVFQYLTARARGGPGPLGMPLHPLTGEVLADLDDFDYSGYRDENDRAVAASVRHNLDAAVAFARQWRPHLVLHDLMNMDGILAAQVTGVPAACHLWGPVGPEETEPGTHLVPRDHTGTFERYGAPEMSAGLIEYVIDPCPPDMAAPASATRIAARFEPYNGQGSLPGGGLPAKERTRICVIWGHSLIRMLGPRAFKLPEIAAALAGADADVLVACHPDSVPLVGTLPPNFTVLGYCPLNALLPDADLVIHNSGSGCAMTAAAMGIPQLFMPFTPEAALNARRISALGVGIALDGQVATVDEVAASTGALLRDDGFRTSATRVSTEMAARPGPGQVVAELERLARAT